MVSGWTPRVRVRLSAVAFAAMVGCCVVASARAELGRLTVDEAVRMAMHDNSTVYQAAKQVEEAQGSYNLTRSSSLPQLSASADLGLNRTGEQRSDFLGGEVTPGTNSTLRRGSITLDHSLFNMQSWNLVGEASHTVGAARAGEAGARQNVALAVKQQFYSLVRAKRLAAVNAEAAHLDSSTLVLTQALFDVGTAPRTDLLKARTQQAQGRLNLITARHSVDIERLRLASLLGLSDDRGLDVDESLPEEVAVPDSTTILPAALQNRPELRQSELQIAAAEAGLSAARASRYPIVGASLTLQKTISITDQDSSAQLSLDHFNVTGDTSNINSIQLVPVYRTLRVKPHFESRPFSWSIGGRISLPIFDGLSTRGRIQQREAELDIQRRSLTQRRVDVTLEVRQAWLALQDARERIRVARDALAFAQESYELNREKYRLGSSTLLDLTTAEVELTRSRSDLVDAGVGLQLARAQLDRALGANP